MIRSFIRRFRASTADADFPLLGIIRETIRKSGAINFQQYMELVLQHPEFGYYRQGNPIGEKGDFSTAPEISQMFGEMIGLWCIKTWEKMGRPNPFSILELGPGLGTLLQDLLRMTAVNEDFQQALKIQLLESNETLRAIQKDKLQKFLPVHIEDLSQLAAMPTIVIANEFFDNLPARQFKKTNGIWFERLVSINKNRDLAIEERGLSSDELEELGLNKKGGNGQNAFCEISEQSLAVIKELAVHISKFGGAGIIIDYGHDGSSGDNSITGWKNQRQVDVLSCPGFVDVTVDVDFSAISRAAQQCGLYVGNLMGQGEFLLKYGIMERASFLCEITSASEVDQINDALYQLLSPLKMGKIWKAMVIGACGDHQDIG